MTDSEVPGTRIATRRARAQREILDAAWAVMAREGVAALSVREVARSVGIRQQSLTYYYPTKQALLDALFADGFADLRQRLDALPAFTDPVEGVVDVAIAFVDHCVARPAAYHLMFQGTVPGFEPMNTNSERAGSSRRSPERRSCTATASSRWSPISSATSLCSITSTPGSPTMRSAR